MAIRGNPARRQRALWALCAAVAASQLSRGVRADEGEGQGESPPGAPVIERTTPPVVAEAIRPAELPEDPSSFTTVIDVKEFAGESKSIDQLLEQSVGVQVRRFGGPGQPAEISIRGSTGSQVVVLLDGVRLNSAQSGSVDLSTLSADLVERIEVSRGGGSVQTGSDAIGGVINIITKRPSARPETSLAVARGSFHTWQASVSQTGRLGGAELAFGYDFFKTSGDWTFLPRRVELDGVLVPTQNDDPIQRINNRTENHAALLKVGGDLGDHWRIEAGDQFFYGEGGRPGLDDPSGGPLAGQSPTGFLRRVRNVADVRVRGADLGEPGLDFGAQLFHRFERNRFTDETSSTGVDIDSDDRNMSLGTRFDLGGDATLGDSTHGGSLGLELRRDDLDSKQAGKRHRNVLGLFVQDEIGFAENRLRFIPAVRFDATEGFENEWIPRLGFVAEPWTWLRLKANVERSYRVPNFDELFFNDGEVRGNPALQPEDAVNIDGGFVLGFERLGPVDDVGLEVAGFYSDIENSIVFQDVSTTVVAATNITDAEIVGVEVGGRFRVVRWIGLSANWTWLDTEIRRTGAPLPGRPDNEVSARLQIGPPNGLFKLVGELHYTGDIPTNASGTTIIPARTVYDASVSLDLNQMPWLGARLPTRQLLLSVAVTNLTDIAVRDSVGFPQPGRILTFRIEGRR